MERGLDGLTLAEAADPAEEALVIALALRESLETENARAALVTPDRSLARRVAGELRRWDIAVDDSAGRPLAHMSAGAFLCLVAEAAQYGFAPVPLLALLKHPFATLGGEAAALRAMARRLDRALRGPRPDAGLGGITRHLAKLAASERSTEKDGTLIAWWSGVADALAPLEAGFAKSEIALDALVNIHITVAEHMACGAVTTDCPLWRGPDGEAATRLMSQLLESAHDLLSVYPGDYPAFFHGLAMKAAVACLKEFPRFNSSYDSAKSEVVLKRYYNIGVAVDTPNGLVVPVIRNVDQKTVLQLAAELTELAGKARDRKLQVSEMQGGTFTITNLGGVGGTAFTPIVNYPEVAILGMSRSQKQLQLVNGDISERLMLPLSLSYDHRVVNGADAARFTVKLANMLSDAFRLLIEV